MSEYKKFLFDNFILDEDGETQEVPSELEVPATDTAVIIPEGADKSNEDELNQTETAEPKEELERKEPKNEEKEESLPEVITYTEEEVADKIEESRKEGYAQGLAAATNSSEAQIQNLLQEIDKVLQEKLKEEDGIKKAMENGFKVLGLTLLESFISGIEKEQAEELLNKFLEDNFANFIKEPKLTFYFNPEIIKQAQEIVARLAHKKDYEGKIVLQKDSTLGLSDCRVEWESGGAERNSTEMKEQARALLSEL